MGRWSVYALLLVVAACQALLHADEAPAVDSSKSVLRLGFSSSMFAGVNENDAKAAMKIWAQAILLEHNVAVIAESQVLNGNDEIASAVRNKLLDAVSLTTEEYRALGGEWMSTNAIIGVNEGLITQEYLVLVHADSQMDRIEDLKGHSLVFFQNPTASLAPVWLDTQLLKSGLGQTRQVCVRVTQGAKLSQVVLPVFFRQIDACVVTRRGFKTMVELNPQVGQRLKILGTSPPLVPVVFVFRADYSGTVRDRILTDIDKVHTTVASQQVLTLFQCENLAVHSVSCLAPALELLANHARLCGLTSQVGLNRSNGPISNAKGGGL